MLRDELIKRLNKAASKNTQYYNANQKPMRFRVGQNVLLRMTNIVSKRLSKKLDFKLNRPFVISECISKLAYRLKLPT